MPAFTAVLTQAPAWTRAPGAADSSATRYAVVSAGATKSPAHTTAPVSVREARSEPGAGQGEAEARRQRRQSHPGSGAPLDRAVQQPAHGAPGRQRGEDPRHGVVPVAPLLGEGQHEQVDGAECEPHARGDDDRLYEPAPEAHPPGPCA